MKDDLVMAREAKPPLHLKGGKGKRVMGEGGDAGKAEGGAGDKGVRSKRIHQPCCDVSLTPSVANGVPRPRKAAEGPLPCRHPTFASSAPAALTRRALCREAAGWRTRRGRPG
jgi:hypothetical protein